MENHKRGGAGKLQHLCRETRVATRRFPPVLIAKYDVFPNPTGAGFLLDVQTDLLDDLNSQTVVMVTQFIAAIPVDLLKSPVGQLSERSAEITTAIDMLIQGL